MYRFDKRKTKNVWTSSVKGPEEPRNLGATGNVSKTDVIVLSQGSSRPTASCKDAATADLFDIGCTYYKYRSRQGRDRGGV